jgi:trk system potassium uptake protein TrkA
MKIIIIGGGRYGSQLADLLSEEKHDVVVVERSRKSAERLAEASDCLVLHGDGRREDVLKEAGLQECDAVVVLTGDDKTNLEIAKMLSSKRSILKINDPSSEHYYEGFKTINPVHDSLINVKKILEKPGKRLVSVVGGGKACVFEVVARNHIKGKRISEISKSFVVSLIYRRGKAIIPENDVIQENDVLVITALRKDANKIERFFDIK